MKFLFILIFVASCNFVFSHKYYFGFAEIEYNEINQTIEGTLTFNTEDIEKHLLNEGMEFKDLASCRTFQLQEIETALFKHLKISGNDKSLILKLEAYEVFLDGTSQFYFTSETFKPVSQFNIQFDLLFNIFEEQQNKITLIYRNKKYTEIFLHNNIQKILEL